MNDAPTPTVSVVIATSTAGPRLQAVMERLQSGHVETTAVEVVIAVPDVTPAVEAARRAMASVVSSNQRSVRVIPVPAASVPALYAAGLRAARGASVAMTNDRFLPDAGWVAAVVRRSTALAGGEAVIVAGIVEAPAHASLVERAVYYMEYGAFAPPVTFVASATTGDAAAPAGAAGANVLYSAAAVAFLRPLTERPAWEYFWHEALVARGATLTRDDVMAVRMVSRWTLGRAWHERYHYARAFAAERARPLGRGVRIVRGLLSLVLPPVLLLRLCRQHARHGWPFLSTLPVVGLLTVPWAWGEAIGMWAGGGDSLGRVSLG